MTKKHFEAIARALSAALAQSTIEASTCHDSIARLTAIRTHHDLIVARLCIGFSDFNPGFDAARFETAAQGGAL